jgi:hypothetical protein
LPKFFSPAESFGMFKINDHGLQPLTWFCF